MTGYRVFGLGVRSEIALPELMTEDSSEAPDVTISRGPVPEPAKDGAGLHGSGTCLTLVIPDVGRYWVEDGRTIVVDALPGVPERNVRLFLLGSAFGALLHQRGLLPLHANAVEIDGKAVAFMGPSGAGKSTLAAWFHDCGYRVMADDVCVVKFDEEGQALAAPGLPRFRLWQEALEAFGRSASDYAQSYLGDDSFRKFDVPVGEARRAVSELPLAAIYILAEGPDLRVTPMSGIGAAEAVIANTYRGGFLSDPGQVRIHFETAVKIVEKVLLFRCERMWSLGHIDRQAAAIVKHFRHTCGPVSPQIP